MPRPTWIFPRLLTGCATSRSPMRAVAVTLLASTAGVVGTDAVDSASITPKASSWPASITSGVVTRNPAGTPVISMRIGPLEAVDALRGHLEFTGAAGSHHRVGAGEYDLEVRPACTNGKYIPQPGALEPAHVLDLDHIVAVGRGREEQTRVLAELSVGIIVILIKQRKDRQSVGDELRSGRMRGHDVARLAERVGQGGRVEIAPAGPLAWVGSNPESGPRGKSENLTTSPFAYR